MRPYQVDELTIKVEDEFGNVYKQEEIEFSTFMGIFETSVTIEDSAVFGMWKILLKSGDSDEVVVKKAIKVQQKLPLQFVVNVKSKPWNLLTEDFVNLEIFANYFDEILVKGKVKIIAHVAQVNDIEGLWKSETKKVEVDSKVNVTFNIKDDLKIVSDKNYLVFFDVEFVEIVTGQKVTKRHEIIVCNKPCHGLQIVFLSKALKPGFPFQFQVNLIDNLEWNQKISAKITYFSNQTSPAFANETLNGITTINEQAKFTISIPLNTTSVSIVATYQGSETSLSIKSFASKARESLSVKLQNENLKAGDDISLKVESTAEMSVVHFAVFHIAKIIHQGQSLTFWRNSTEIVIESSSKMQPFVDIFVFFIHESGEMISDELRVVFKEDEMQQVKNVKDRKCKQQQS